MSVGGARSNLRRRIAAVFRERQNQSFDVRLEHSDELRVVNLVEQVRQLVPEGERDVRNLRP